MDAGSLFSVLRNPVAIWFVLAVFFVMLDFTTPTLVSMFFGMGALVAMFLVWIFPASPVWLQGLVFLVSSIAAIVLLRQRLSKIFMGRSSNGATAVDDEFAGRTCTVRMAVGRLPGGRVEFRGADWSAVSQSGDDIPAGTSCRIISREGLVLTVVKLD